MKNKRYGSIDGLRTIACFGIVMMHMAVNNNYKISGLFYNIIIPSFANFVFLFMTVSAFGMCCGYYEKIIYNKISFSDFYGKRFKKIWPFFAVLVFLDIVVSPSLSSLYEAFADLTLLFGFFSNSGNISVIGVGWFIGLIFVFYSIFPFFCYLIENKRRAWISFGISLLYNYACNHYFEVGRENILFDGCFFLAGGLIYLYRDKIIEIYDKVKASNWIALIMVIISIALYYALGGNYMCCLLMSAVLLLYAIIKDGEILDNQIMHFFSSISMEIYLSHMAVFRILEKLHINTMLGNGWSQYILIMICVWFGAAIFSFILQYFLNLAQNIIEKYISRIRFSV